MANIRFEEVSKEYSSGHPILKNFNLEIKEGEFLVLVGPSGCGKTTALRLVAGLEQPTSGKILQNQKCVNNVPPKDRDVAMVFQNYALYPHMTVYQNIAFGIRLRALQKIKFWQWKLKKQIKLEVDQKVKEVAIALGVQNFLDRYPKQLSGGQKQRVALARAIIRKPTIFLMDEPLSNLDAQLRTDMRTELIRLHRKLGITTLYVTHDQIEAMTMGHRVAVIKDGILQQCDKPETIYDYPINLFVAQFIGVPKMNVLEGIISSEGTSVYLPALSINIPIAQTTEYKNKEVWVGIRPEAIVTQGEESFQAEVEVLEPLGPEYTAYLKINEVCLVSTLYNSLEVGALNRFSLKSNGINLFDKETEKNIFPFKS